MIDYATELSPSPYSYATQHNNDIHSHWTLDKYAN